MNFSLIDLNFHEYFELHLGDSMPNLFISSAKTNEGDYGQNLMPLVELLLYPIDNCI